MATRSVLNGKGELRTHWPGVPPRFILEHNWGLEGYKPACGHITVDVTRIAAPPIPSADRLLSVCIVILVCAGARGINIDTDTAFVVHISLPICKYIFRVLNIYFETHVTLVFGGPNVGLTSSGGL